MKIYPFCQRVYIRKQSLLLWCQDLKMRHGFLGVQLWDLTLYMKLLILTHVGNSLVSVNSFMLFRIDISERC